MQDVQLTNRTVYGIQLQASQYFKVPMEIKAHSTLNEKLNIQQNFTAIDTEKLHVNLVFIGNGGLKASVSTSGQMKLLPVPHKPRHAGLYNQLPFVLRLPSNDLTSSERAKYRLRRSEVHDGVTYIAYYGKVLDLSSSIASMELRTVDGTNVISTPFSPTLEDLHPTQPALTSGNALVATGDYVACSVNVRFTMSPAELDEFKEVCNIIYGEDGYANITELAFGCSEDTVVNGDFNGVTLPYTEAVGVMITNFAASGVLAEFMNQNVDITFDVGGNEPLLDLS